MTRSEASTVTEYLRALPADRRADIEHVRAVILRSLPAGYEETMQYGMIGYVVPLTLYPAGYLGKKDTPLPYAGLASQKNYMAVYLLNIYSEKNAEDWFAKAYRASGKKLDMGKSCVRFRKLEDLPLDVIGAAIGRTPVPEFIRQYEESRRRRPR